MKNRSDAMRDGQIWELSLKVTSQEMTKQEVKSEEGKNRQRRVDGAGSGLRMKKAGREGGLIDTLFWFGPIRERLPLFGHHVRRVSANENEVSQGTYRERQKTTREVKFFFNEKGQDLKGQVGA